MFGRSRPRTGHRSDPSDPSGPSGPAGRGRHVTGRRHDQALRPARAQGPRATAGTRGAALRPDPAPAVPSARHATGGAARPGPAGLLRGRPGARSAAATAVTVALAVGLVGDWAGGVEPAGAATATLTRSRYAPTGTGGWLNDRSLGRTSSADQYAQAQVSGLSGGDRYAGFLVRYADRDHRVRVAVSGTGWRIEPSGEPATTGTFAHGASGLLRVEAVGRTVTVRWNGTAVARRSLGHAFTGRAVVPAVRQPRPGVVLTALRAGTQTAASGSSAAAADRPATTAAARRWLSGAASDQAAAGTFGAWRRSPLGIGGTWEDTYDGQLNHWTICSGGIWSRWNAPLDLAFGGIFRSRGETWAAAAGGAYDARWSAALTTIRRCWGSRDPGMLYLRFAHELNLPNDWAVRRGEEASFVKAITRFSDLRYRILPKAKVVLCPNDGTDGSLGGLDVRRLWPGKDARGRRVADVYAVDSYNSWPHATTAAAFTRKINGRYPDGAPLGIEAHRQQAQRWGVPFAIGEWANDGDPAAGGGGGESPVYVQQFNAWARAHAGDVARPQPGQLLYEVHFNLWSQFSLWPATRQPRTAAAYRALTWGR